MQKNDDRNLTAYRLLVNVFQNGAYGSIELNTVLNEISDVKDRAYVTCLFYGVLEKSVQFDYFISKLTQKKSKMSVIVLLKMGFYQILYMNTPDYAAINNCVELCKKIGKDGVKGFVNAVLRAVKTVDFPDKKNGISAYYSVIYSVPEWIIKKLLSDYDEAFVENYYGTVLDKRTHIRNNSLKIDKESLLKLLKNKEETSSGIYVDSNELKGIDKSLYTIQSLASQLASRFYAEGEKDGVDMLDLCAAPGGKSVYFFELIKANVIACDLHQNRVDLIKGYVKRMGATISAMKNDALIFNKDFEDRFDCVICDVPCSGLGVTSSKPDIFLNRKPSDIADLTKVQYEILDNAAKYVKVGGHLNYSTCTIIKDENEAIIKQFLQEHSNFKLVKSTMTDINGYFRLYPHTNKTDGFFAAKLIRSKK